MGAPGVYAGLKDSEASEQAATRIGPSPGNADTAPGIARQEPQPLS